MATVTGLAPTALLTPRPSLPDKATLVVGMERQGSVAISDAAIQTVRGALPAALQHHALALDDANVRRFIRATGGDLKASAKRLANTITWREKNKPEECVCQACLKDPKSHYMHVIGHDVMGRPIIYSCLAPPTNKSFEANHEHMIQTFEHAIRCMPPGVEQWVWVCDFRGFGVADLNPKLAKAFLSVSAEHYPERLGMFMIVDAPSLFSVLWRAISGFVDPKTSGKIRFLPNDLKATDSSLRSCLDSVCGASVGRWLAQEITENRDAKLAAKKAYSLHDVLTAASTGRLGSTGDRHDLRGSSDLLHLYKTSPRLFSKWLGLDDSSSPCSSSPCSTCESMSGSQ